MHVSKTTHTDDTAADSVTTASDAFVTPSSTPIESTDTNKTHSEAGEKKESLLDLARFAIIALIIVLPIRMFVAQPYIVAGPSMQETFQNADYIIVDRISYRFHEPAAGDVIVFNHPQDTSKSLIKRIIGVPGDTVSVDGSVVTVTNTTYPDGRVLTEPYITPMTKDLSPNPITLREDEYYVMGDNRDQSSDSRMWGVINSSHISGQALMRGLPFGDAGVYPGHHEINYADTSPPDPETTVEA